MLLRKLCAKVLAMYPQQGVRRSARLSALQNPPPYHYCQKHGGFCSSSSEQIQDLQTKDKQVLKRGRRKSRPLKEISQTVVAPMEEKEIELTEESQSPEPPTKRARSPRPQPDRSIEEELWQKGYLRIAGVDEAGRGPLAGPVVSAACIIPQNVSIEGIRDSKQISEKKREAIYEELMQHPEVECSVAILDAKEIDDINILQATLKGMDEAVQKLPGGYPNFVLIDGNQRPKGIEAKICQTLVKGDTKCVSIAAASILAKVTRDRLMLTYDKTYPQYGFAIHKGYPTKAHIAAVRKFGQCEIHRKSFKLKNP